MDDNIIVTEQEILEDERIDAFFRGKMCDDDAQQFLKDLESYPQLRNKAVAMAHIIKAMDEVGSQQDAETVEQIKSMSEEEITDIINEVSKPAQSKLIPLWRKHSVILSIAASLMLLFIIGGGYQYVDYRHTQSLADTYALTFDSPSYVKGEESADVTKELAELYQNIKESKNIDATISRLTELWELSKQNTYNNYTNYSDEIGYELAIAYLRDNNKDEAKQVLQSLEQIIENDSELGKKIDTLLEEL